MGPAGDSTGQKFLPLWLLQGVTLYWLGLKVFALFAGEPHADEAYYWAWGQHPALSYLDHPGLHAWLQGLMATLFGWSMAGLRALSLVTAAIVLWVLYVWSRRLAPERWQSYFWLGAALFWSSPLMTFYTTIATPDRLLVALALLSIHCFALAFANFREGRAHLAPLYLGALFLGLATLTKYNGVLLGLGMAAVIVMRADLRGLLRSPHLWLAAALSIALQAPTVIWNLEHGFATISFHAVERADAFDLSRFTLDRTLVLLVETVVLVSPFALWGMARLVFTRAREGFAGSLHSTARGVFTVSSVVTFALTLVRYVLFYWNIVAYAAFFGLAAWFIRSRVMQALQIAYGMILSTVLLAQFTVGPVLLGVGMTQPYSSDVFGWREVAAAVRAAEAEHGTDFVAGSNWQIAARLGFALGRADLASISEDRDAYDFWFDEGAIAGRDAIIVDEPRDPEDWAYVVAHFDSIEQVGEITPDRLGRPLVTYQLFVGRGYRAVPREAQPDAQAMSISTEAAERFEGP
jgi:4-amino-4-deoxy-L-arabinose transferase-like glycosyltransferase